MDRCHQHEVERDRKAERDPEADPHPKPSAKAGVTPSAKPAASASITASPTQAPTSGPAKASVIIVNATTYAIWVNVDGSSVTVAGGASSAPMYFVPSDTNNDNFQIRSVAHPGCGDSNDGGYNLTSPHRYRM